MLTPRWDDDLIDNAAADADIVNSSRAAGTYIRECAIARDDILSRRDGIYALSGHRAGVCFHFILK